jgi:hypothetical protein
MKRLMTNVGLMLIVAMPLTVHAQRLDDTMVKFFHAGTVALGDAGTATSQELRHEYEMTSDADFLAGCVQAESTGHVEPAITELCAHARAAVDAASPENRLEIQERALRLRMSTLK